MSFFGNLVVVSSGLATGLTIRNGPKCQVDFWFFIVWQPNGEFIQARNGQSNCSSLCYTGRVRRAWNDGWYLLFSRRRRVENTANLFCRPWLSLFKSVEPDLSTRPEKSVTFRFLALWDLISLPQAGFFCCKKQICDNFFRCPVRCRPSISTISKCAETVSHLLAVRSRPCGSGGNVAQAVAVEVLDRVNERSSLYRLNSFRLWLRDLAIPMHVDGSRKRRV